MQFVRKQMKEQQFDPSYVSAIYEKADGKMTEEEEHVLKYSAASLYSGGADTVTSSPELNWYLPNLGDPNSLTRTLQSVSTMATFFLAMMLHPQVQLQAKEEIDRVVGDGRLPDTNDRVNLPYIEAVLKEAFRWHPIAPMGFPHSASEDDVFQGYLIPKDATILPNIWCVAIFFLCAPLSLSRSSLSIGFSSSDNWQLLTQVVHTRPVRVS
jgi:hypothetical protein